MAKLIIFDFEIFKYDTLLGAKIISNDGIEFIQTWNLDEIRDLYYNNTESIWIGHNNKRYDNLILQAIVDGMLETELKDYSNYIIHSEDRANTWLHIKLNYYDCMTAISASLKQTEALDGKNISETEVDFSLDRPLTELEKQLTESYNRDDVEQTYSNFMATKAIFQLRVQIANEFGLSLHTLHMTEAQIAEEVLHAKKTPGIDTWVLKPFEYPTLRVKNQRVKDFFFTEEYVNGSKLEIDICNVSHTLGLGGIHSARSKYHTDKAYYLDVSGYYNLVMINYNLLPRSIDKNYEHLYPTMYKQQLEFKKTAPEKRGAYKTILLAVFGAMFNEHCKFYDPYKARLVTMTGQIFLVDLLEKLEGKIELVQSNTDGIIVKLINNTTESELKSIIDEWQERTGFVLKFDTITDVWQRDVNCYCYKDANGGIHCRGDLKHYWGLDYTYSDKLYNAKEAFIISIAVVEYLINKVLPETTIAQNKNKLRAFQYICKKMSYDYMQYEECLSDGTIVTTDLQHVNRAFAYKSDASTGMIYKYKTKNGKLSKSKVSSLPDSVFVYNNEILSEKAVNELTNKIDYQYYIDRAYERILEFVDIIQIKDIKL